MPNPHPALPRDSESLVWQPDVTVASVVVRDGALLMVEEFAHGRLVLNQPAGHLEPNESILDAAIRETLEESGWDIEPTALIGMYQWQAPSPDDGSEGRHFLRVAIAARPVRHYPDRPLDTGIAQALWLTPAQLQAQTDRHRSPLVWRVVRDYLAGQRVPLATLVQMP